MQPCNINRKKIIQLYEPCMHQCHMIFKLKDQSTFLYPSVCLGLFFSSSQNFVCINTHIFLNNNCLHDKQRLTGIQSCQSSLFAALTMIRFQRTVCIKDFELHNKRSESITEAFKCKLIRKMKMKANRERKRILYQRCFFVFI